jgi:hypothetical protein
MASQEGRDYVAACQAQGMTPEQIRAGLAQAGWTPEQIEAAMGEIGAPLAASTANGAGTGSSGRGRKILKRIGLSLGTLVVLAGLVWFSPYVLGLAINDLDDLDDTAMAVQVEPVADSDNAFLNLRQATRKIENIWYNYERNRPRPYELIEEVYAGEPLAENDLEWMLKRYADSLADFAAATGKPQYLDLNLVFMLESGDLANESISYALDNLAEVIVISMIGQRAAGDTAGYIRTARDALALSDRMLASPLDGMGLLQVTAFQKTIVEGVLALSDGQPIDRSEWSGFLSDLLEESEDVAVTMERLIKMDYSLTAARYDLIAREDMSSTAGRYWFHPNRMKQSLGSDYQLQLQALAEQPCSNYPGAERREMPTKHEVLLRFIPNGWGQAWLPANTVSGVERVREGYCKHLDWRRLAATAVAIRLYMEDNHRKSRPNALSDLVPKYLDSLPQDVRGRDLYYDVGQLHVEGGQVFDPMSVPVPPPFSPPDELFFDGVSGVPLFGQLE